MLDKLKVAVVLVVIGAISGALIFGANYITEDVIIANAIEKEFNYYAEIFDLDAIPTEENVEKTLLDGVLTEEVVLYDNLGAVVGYIYKGADKNSYGDVDVLVGVNLDGTIRSVVISNSSNTPTFVNIIKTEYLVNFEGQDMQDVTFDAKTGASFTYGSVQKIVDAASTYFQENRGVTND